MKGTTGRAATTEEGAPSKNTFYAGSYRRGQSQRFFKQLSQCKMVYQLYQKKLKTNIN